MITTIHRGINEKGRVLILLRGWAADKTGVQIQEDAKKMYIEEAPVQVSMLTTGWGRAGHASDYSESRGQNRQQSRQNYEYEGRNTGGTRRADSAKE